MIKMRKEVIAVLIVVLALALAGCQSSGNSTTPPSSTPFIGGTAGLSVKFAPNSPPAEVTDFQKGQGALDNAFNIDVLLENIGEYTVLNGKATVTITGISASDFLGTSSTAKSLSTPTTDELTEVKKDTEGNKIPGSVADVKFENLAFRTTLAGNAAFPVQAEVCYPYETKAVTDLCIRSDATKTAAGVCQITGQKTVYNSGAPIQVTSVKESVGGRSKVLLTFNVKVVGTGLFFKQLRTGAVECSKGTFSKENLVLVEVNTGLPGTLSCSGLTEAQKAAGDYSGYLRIDNGQGTFSCIQDTPPEDSIKKINLKLDYNTLTTASTSILVKHLPTEEPTTPGTNPVTNPATNPSGASLPTVTFRPGDYTFATSPTTQTVPVTIDVKSLTSNKITSLQVSVPTGWQQTNTLPCEAGTSCTGIYTITIPGGADPKPYDITASAVTADGTGSGKLTITLVVKPSDGMPKITFSDPNPPTILTTTHSFDLRVTATTLNSINPVLSVTVLQPTGWSATPQSQICTATVTNSCPVTFTITTPSDITAGPYTIGAMAVSGGSGGGTTTTGAAPNPSKTIVVQSP